MYIFIHWVAHLWVYNFQSSSNEHVPYDNNAGFFVINLDHNGIEISLIDLRRKLVNFFPPALVFRCPISEEFN